MTPTKCVILAAGMSKRLRPHTDALPKALLRVGAMTLLERTIRNVLAAGIRSFGIVTGFEERKLRTSVSRLFPRLSVTYIHNPRFRSTNNAASLFLAQEFVEGGPFLLLDSDLLFGPDLLKTLMEAPRKPNRIAVRVSGQHDEEEIRVRINRWDHVQEIGKKVPIRDTYGESIGIAVFSADAARTVFAVLQKRMGQGQGRTEFYEAAFQEAIDGGMKLWAVDVSAFPAIEIDTPDDLERARTLAATLDDE